MFKLSLQGKILTLITSLILFVTLAFTSIIAYMEVKQTEQNIGQRALQVATAISFMPMVKEAFTLETPSDVIQPLAEKIREKVGAEFIVIGNENSIRYSHPDPEKLGHHMVGGDNARALQEGDYYTSKAIGSLGPSLRGKAPIFNDNGEIIGIVSVGFMINDIQSVIFNKLSKIGLFALAIIAVGIAGGVWLTKNIRKDTMGLEPHEIAALFRERHAILYSISEGIIAIDQAGTITMMNRSARHILNLPDGHTGGKIEDVLPNTKMYHVLNSGFGDKNEEMILRDRHVIVNRTPIIENGEVMGVVASFKDKTEVNDMINTLSEVREYSEDMRAQTHEFTNKLYVLSGLLQLGHYDEAIQFIDTESEGHSLQNKLVMEQIQDKTVQAILLGKIGKASEKKVQLTIDPNSSLSELPAQMSMPSLIMILGNVIDNAMEAVDNQREKQVTFFATDIGNEVVFEVSDNGVGILDEHIEEIFQRGFSTKESADRGYGLATVKETVDQLGGFLQVDQPPEGGTVFSIFLPKEKKTSTSRGGSSV